MIGSVNRRRAPSAKRSRARTSANAAMVPMTVAMMETTTATITELSTACWMNASPIIFSYQCSVRPVIGRPGVDDVSNENTTMNTIGM